ncbi:MAG: sigma-70 family RNA polymerase sigma factor [Opitutales bacterium]|nr:sigma-70 family RNA polymerase sigma factor [Opitutales bacterium]
MTDTKVQQLGVDELLVERMRQGDDKAFEQVVNLYWDRIYSRVLQLLKNPQDAEEVTQDAFMRAHRGLANFRGDSAFSTWLFQIATNLAHNRYWYWWRRKRDYSMSLDQTLGHDSDTTLVDVLPSTEDGPEEDILTNELTRKIEESLPKLNRKHRDILALRIKDNLSYEEIAQKLGIRVGTVKSRIARARESLREKLGSDFL